MKHGGDGIGVAKYVDHDVVLAAVPSDDILLAHNDFLQGIMQDVQDGDVKSKWEMHVRNACEGWLSSMVANRRVSILLVPERVLIKS